MCITHESAQAEGTHAWWLQGDLAARRMSVLTGELVKRTKYGVRTSRKRSFDAGLFITVLEMQSMVIGTAEKCSTR